MRSSISKGLLTAAATATGVLSLSGGYAQASDASGVAANSPGVLSGNNVQVPIEVPVNLCGNTVDPVGLLNPAFGNTCANTSGEGSMATAHNDAARPMAQRPMPAAAPSQHHSARESAHGGPLAERHPAAHDRQTTHDTADPMYGFHNAVPHTADVPQGYGADATGTAVGSPGVLSGNLTQLPVHIPVNACGNSIDVVGLLNPAFGNTCVNDSTPPPQQQVTPPPHPHVPPPAHVPPTHRYTPPAHVPSVPVVHHTPVQPPAPQLARTGADGNLLGAAAMSAGLMLGGVILYRRAAVAARV